MNVRKLEPVSLLDRGGCVSARMRYVRSGQTVQMAVQNCGHTVAHPVKLPASSILC